MRDGDGGSRWPRRKQEGESATPGESAWALWDGGEGTFCTQKHTRTHPLHDTIVESKPTRGGSKCPLSISDFSGRSLLKSRSTTEPATSVIAEVMPAIDTRLEKALQQRGSLARWLEFVGGSEFSQLTPLLQGMRLDQLIRIPASGLARLGMVPSTARRLADELNKLKAVLRGGVRMPPWLMPLLEPNRTAEARLLDANPLTLGPPASLAGASSMPPSHPVEPRAPNSARPATAGRARQQQQIGNRPASAMPSTGRRPQPPAPAPPASARPASARPASARPAMARPASARPASARPAPSGARASAGAPATLSKPRWASSVPHGSRHSPRGSEIAHVGYVRSSDPSCASAEAAESVYARNPPRRPFSARAALPTARSAWPGSAAAPYPTVAPHRTAPSRGGLLPRGGRPSTATSARPVGGMFGGRKVGGLVPPRASSASPRTRQAPPRGKAPPSPRSLLVPSAGVLGVGGGIVGTAGGAGGYGAAGHVDDLPRGLRPQRRSRSAGRRRGCDAFSAPPRGALSLSNTAADQRPVGLLGAVLRREAAIAALKNASQVAPAPVGTRERRKLLRELGEMVHELREATVDAIELLHARPRGSARFYWNGMDLVLKMLTDLQWGPFPQTVDPLLWKWFGIWSNVWQVSGSVDPAPFAAGEAALYRMRAAERQLLEMAKGASEDGAGLGAWGALSTAEAVATLRVVQTHRLMSAHSEGGANHAQRRRFANLETILYGQADVHLSHLERLQVHTTESSARAASFIQHLWRIRKMTRTLANRAGIELQDGQPRSPPPVLTHLALSMGTGLSLVQPRQRASYPKAPTAIESVVAGGSAEASPERSPVGGAVASRPPAADSLMIDRSYLAQMSVGLPDLS